MTVGPEPRDPARLTLVMRAGGFAFALEAQAVALLEPIEKLGADPARSPRLLSRLLEVAPAGEPSVAVVLRDRPEILLVESVDGVRDLGEARFIALPSLTRLARPVLRGVWQLETDELLPALELDGLLRAGGGDG